MREYSLTAGVSGPIGSTRARSKFNGQLYGTNRKIYHAVNLQL